MPINALCRLDGRRRRADVRGVNYVAARQPAIVPLTPDVGVVTVDANRLREIGGEVFRDGRVRRIRLAAERRDQSEHWRMSAFGELRSRNGDPLRSFAPLLDPKET